MGSPDGHRLIAALIVAALLYGVSLIVDPVGGTLGTAARQKITGQVQAPSLVLDGGCRNPARAAEAEVGDHHP
jgi:hypothetical protein